MIVIHEFPYNYHLTYLLQLITLLMKMPSPTNMIMNIMMRYQKELLHSSTHLTELIKPNTCLLVILLVIWLVIELLPKRLNPRDFNLKLYSQLLQKYSDNKLSHKNLSDSSHKETSN